MMAFFLAVFTWSKNFDDLEVYGEKERKEIREDVKDFPKEKGEKKADKQIIPLATKALVESIAENGRDKFLYVEMFVKELKERRGIINKYVLTV